jgi:hypothetical protein
LILRRRDLIIEHVPGHVKHEREERLSAAGMVSPQLRGQESDLLVDSLSLDEKVEWLAASLQVHHKVLVPCPA